MAGSYEPTPGDVELAAIARSNGCEPVWTDGIVGWAYHCFCRDGLHHMDQQCSAISPVSALRRREVETIEEAEPVVHPQWTLLRGGA